VFLVVREINSGHAATTKLALDRVGGEARATCSMRSAIPFTLLD
jgi:hypothetical protein